MCTKVNLCLSLNYYNNIKSTTIISLFQLKLLILMNVYIIILQQNTSTNVRVNLQYIFINIIICSSSSISIAMVPCILLKKCLHEHLTLMLVLQNFRICCVPYVYITYANVIYAKLTNMPISIIIKN